MHPAFILAFAAVFAQAIHDAPSQATPAAASASGIRLQYATLLASMGPCKLDMDTVKAYQWAEANGLDTSTQEEAEAVGQDMWTEGQRIYTMSAAEQDAHCAEMRATVAELGLR